MVAAAAPASDRSSTASPANASTPSVSAAAVAPSTSSQKKNRKKKKANGTSPQPAVDELVVGADAAAEIEAAAVPTPVTTSDGQSKGALEEFVTKRMRVLYKKIQKLKSYQQQPKDSLNPDQISALASLPTLEGAYKELEEVAKTVELVELEQAAKAREQRSEDENEVQKLVQAAISEYERSLVSPLVLFVTLQSLVNPPRTSPTQHFDPLSLPSHLRDHVDLSDAQLVGDLWFRLIAGGEVAHYALKIIRRETDDNGHYARVHELMDILSSPGLPPTSQDVGPQETQQPETSINDEHISEEPTSRGFLNFLQEDELQAGPVPEVEREIQVEPEVDVVPEQVKQQANADDLLIEEVQPVELPTPAEAETVATPAESTSVQAAATPATNWADEGDEEVDLELLRGAFGARTPGSVPEPAAATAPAAAPTPAAVRQIKSQPERKTSSPTPSEASKRSKRAPKKSNGKSSPTPGQTSGLSKGPRQAKPVQTANGNARQPAPLVDDDGFEVKVSKRRPSAVGTTPSGSGGRGRGSGIRTGQGQGGGRGGKTDGQTSNGPRREQTVLQPKPSIYKA